MSGSHSHRHLSTSKIVLILVLLGGLGVGACIATTSASGSPKHQNLDACLTAPERPEVTKPVIAILAGITAGDTSPQIQAERVQTMAKITSAGFIMDARLLVDTIGGGASDADLAVNTQLQANGPNDLFIQSDLACKQAGVTAKVATLNQRTSSSPMDTLSAFQLLESHLTGLTTNGPIDVVLMSDLLNATPPLDLTNQTVLGQDPSSLIAAVRQAGLMPNCAGWSVYVVGAGQNSGGSGISDGTEARLKAFWQAFFASCGGQLVLYDSQLTQFPIRAIPQRPLHSSPGVSESIATLNNQTKITFTLPDTVLFDSGNSTLLPGVDPVLAQLLPILTKRYPTGTIQVTGYTDSVPIDIPGGNLALSQARAQAVTTWLAHHGIPDGRLLMIGLGPANPVGDNATPAGRQANRRVEIIVP